MSATATFVRDLDGFHGTAKLYSLDPPISYEDWSEEERRNEQAHYVVVSAVVAPFTGAETYIFPADEDGAVTSWSELDGSYRGGLDHAAALVGAGYDVSEPA